MIDTKIGFLEVLSRLKLVLDLDDDAAVAARLGLSKTAFNNRKLRGSLPTKAIDALIESECLTQEFIYHGNGPVHRDLNELDWEALFGQRMAKSLPQPSRDILVSNTAGSTQEERYTQAQLKSIAEGIYAPTPKERQGARNFLRLLRDMRQSLKVDLNWLLCGDVGSALDADERALIDAYRKAPAAGKEFIRQAAGMAANVKKE